MNWPYNELLFRMTRLSNLRVDFDEVTLTTHPSLKLLLHRAVIQICFPNDIHPEVKKKLKKQPSPRSRMYEVTKGIFDDSVDEKEENKKRKADSMLDDRRSQHLKHHTSSFWVRVITPLLSSMKFSVIVGQSLRNLEFHLTSPSSMVPAVCGD